VRVLRDNPAGLTTARDELVKLERRRRRRGVVVVVGVVVIVTAAATAAAAAALTRYSNSHGSLSPAGAGLVVIRFTRKRSQRKRGRPAVGSHGRPTALMADLNCH